jgi:hypothetical protein
MPGRLTRKQVIQWRNRQWTNRRSENQPGRQRPKWIRIRDLFREFLKLLI